MPPPPRPDPPAPQPPAPGPEQPDPPAPLRLAAALLALQSTGLAIFGLVEVLRAVGGHPHDRGTAILLGVLLLVYGAGTAAAALGLVRCRRWAQTPTYLVQFFAIVIGIGQLHTLLWLAVPLIAVAALTIVAVSAPASRHALGGI